MFLKLKSDAREAFRQWKVRVKKAAKLITAHKDCTVIRIRTDNEGSFLNSNFVNYITEEGLQFETSTTATPAQNGVAER